jgi:hypothetical protein
VNPALNPKPARFAGLVEWVNLLVTLVILVTAWIFVVQFLDWTSRHHGPHR